VTIAHRGWFGHEEDGPVRVSGPFRGRGVDPTTGTRFRVEIRDGALKQNEVRGGPGAADGTAWNRRSGRQGQFFVTISSADRLMARG
jgi:hypothetical protein